MMVTRPYTEINKTVVRKIKQSSKDEQSTRKRVITWTNKNGSESSSSIIRQQEAPYSKVAV